MKTVSTLSALALALACIVAAGYAQSSNLTEDVTIILEGAPSIGEKSAKVTIVEFSDYQCPLSSRYFNWTMEKVVKDYVKTGKVRYVFRDLPLESIHPLAEKAAEAARCAGDQGKYWEMHDRFFRNQTSIAPEVLPLHAKMLGLDVPRFQKCLDSGEYTATVRGSVTEAKRAGARGTPAFFLGWSEADGFKLKAITFVNGAQPYETFKEAIDTLLSQPSR
jgi:protein-disulfide isomerase